ncbi:3-dehydroquinate dehydratase [Frankliniella fusca]|uniref:3-dehydroquinate dehydratase n=1 Tax=Frankliniella fusca TaxID=407009 RepID=A0AAE1LRF7_9NEOP|nr:3-dehydroquinate dehydratase [Frankliniella fusca]
MFSVMLQAKLNFSIIFIGEDVHLYRKKLLQASSLLHVIGGLGPGHVAALNFFNFAEKRIGILC